MNLFKLSWNYIKSRPLNTLLNVLILAFGVSIIVILLLLSKQVEDKLSKNAGNIDLVVGAKGSPLQLILSSVYHIDYPTGNIPLADAKKVVYNRYVKSAIPLALGDSYGKFRIVGSTHQYPEMYEQKIDEGALWNTSDINEVTIGINVAKEMQLKVGDEFNGGHGVVAGGHAHESPYKVVGIFEQNDNVLDNLILTSIQSVWKMHDAEPHLEQKETIHQHEKVQSKMDSSGRNLVRTAQLRPMIDLPEGENKEITALLIRYNSPMAIINMPRYVNSISTLQAASPSIETARLFSLLGIGIKLFRSFAYLVIFIATLSIFISLYSAMQERKYDLAVMRSLGASKLMLVMHVLLEGVIITVIGGVVGFTFGHGLTELLGYTYPKSSEAGITGLLFVKDELLIGFLCIGTGLVASLLPAIHVYRTDVSSVLARG